VTQAEQVKSVQGPATSHSARNTAADGDRATLASGSGTVEVKTRDLDQLTERIFTVGVLLNRARASGAGIVTSVEDAISELDEVLRMIRSMALRASEPVGGLDALAARLAQAAREASRLASRPVGDINVQVRDAAYCVHRARVAVSEARSAL
jgi:hypothetical protein